jgi:hypothetical protein
MYEPAQALVGDGAEEVVVVDVVVDVAVDVVLDVVVDVVLDVVDVVLDVVLDVLELDEVAGTLYDDDTR